MIRAFIDDDHDNNDNDDGYHDDDGNGSDNDGDYVGNRQLKNHDDGFVDDHRK